MRVVGLRHLLLHARVFALAAIHAHRRHKPVAAAVPYMSRALDRLTLTALAFLAAGALLAATVRAIWKD